MKIANGLVGLSVALGVGKALRRKGGAPSTGELRYRVGGGQDPAAVLAKLRVAGVPSSIDIVGGFEDVVMRCDPVRDRERLRQLLSDAPVDMHGHPFDGHPVVFVDELPD